MAKQRQTGYLVRVSNGQVVFDAYGPNAEHECADAARSMRLSNYRIEETSRDVTVDDSAMREAARVAALLTGASFAPPVWVGSETDSVNETEKEGYNLGASLARIIAPGGTSDTASLVTLGMFYSELKGYRDLRTGNVFVSAFVRGFDENRAGASIESQRRLTNGEPAKSSADAD